MTTLTEFLESEKNDFVERFAPAEIVPDKPSTPFSTAHIQYQLIARLYENWLSSHDSRLIAKIREMGRKMMGEISETHYPDPRNGAYYQGFEAGKELAQDKISTFLSLLPDNTNVCEK